MGIEAWKHAAIARQVLSEGTWRKSREESNEKNNKVYKNNNSYKNMESIGVDNRIPYWQYFSCTHFKYWIIKYC